MSNNLNSIQIDANKIDMSHSMPLEKIPERVTFSISFLVPLRVPDHKGVGLFVYNYSPDSWKLWFPPYHFHNWKISLTESTYAQLIDSALKACPDKNYVQPQGHLPGAIEAINGKFGFTHLEVKDKPLVGLEPWLKFSKTQNQWTLYFFNYYLVTNVEQKSDLLSTSDPLKNLLPLYGSDFSTILSTERYAGMGVVDNLVNFLKQQIHVETLVSNAI